MKQEVLKLYLIYAICFLDLFAVGLVMPLFSTHLRALGASHFTIGLVSSAYSGLQVLSGPIIGGWSDVRNRKSVIIITLLLSGVSYILVGLTNSIGIIVILRFIPGIFKQTQSLCKALISDVVSENERTGAFGQSAAFASIGFIAGPIIGGHLSQHTNGFSYVCALTGLLFFINIGLALNITDQKKQSVQQNTTITQHQSFTGSIKEEFKKSFEILSYISWSQLWSSFLLRFLFGFATTIYLFQQSMYLQEQFNLSPVHIGYTISYYSAIGTASAFLMPFINSFYKNDENCLTRLSHFFGLITICSIGLGFVSNVHLFLVLLAPFSFCCAVLRIVSMELILKQAPNEHRGSLTGASNSIMSLSRFVTPISVGLISDLFGNHFSMLFAAVPTLVGSILIFTMSNNAVKVKA